MSTLELSMHDLESCIFFAGAEAASQGYLLDDPLTRGHFYAHLRQSAFMYFMKRGVETYITLLTPDPELPMGVSFSVGAVILHEGEPFEFATVELPTPTP
jgi:hypothetical protein